MIDRIRSTRATVEPSRLKGHAAELQAILQDAGAKAGMSASQLAEVARSRAAYARDWATPHVGAGVSRVRPVVGHGVDWARPHAEKVWEGSKAKATPHVERAAGAAVPLVDTAHDRLVDDLLPKLVAAVNAAALATTAGADKARDVTSAKLSEIAHIPPPRKSHRIAKALWVLTAVAAIGAAVVAWRRSAPTTDPWAEEPWESSGSEQPRDRAAEAREEFQGVVDDVRHELGDAAEQIGEAAGGAVARTRGATERAREATERAREAAERAAERARAAKKPSRRRAADSDGDSGSQGSEGTGSEGTGSEATGSESTGSQGTGSEATGSEATGSEATGSEATGSQGTESDRDEGTAGAPAADHQLGTTPSDTAATPADIADTIGTQLEGTPADSDDSPESTRIEDDGNRGA